MEQINEKELVQVIKNMNGKTIKVVIVGIIDADVVIYKAKCEFEYRTGILYLNSIKTNRKIVIQMSMAYMIKASADKQEVLIRLDNEQDITIKVI